MLLLGIEQGWTTHQIAPFLKRSHDVVMRVFQRFVAGGLDAVPRRSPPGRQSRVTPAWEAELLRVIDEDPHNHGVESANWTTLLLADYLATKTDVAVDPETVRRHLHRLGYVCKRPTWTVAHKAAEREGWVGNACGSRLFWRQRRLWVLPRRMILYPLPPFPNHPLRSRPSIRHLRLHTPPRPFPSTGTVWLIPISGTRCRTTSAIS